MDQLKEYVCTGKGCFHAVTVDKKKDNLVVDGFINTYNYLWCRRSFRYDPLLQKLAPYYYLSLWKER